jgi:pyrroline-5-carboxylate reductase
VIIGAGHMGRAIAVGLDARAPGTEVVAVEADTGRRDAIRDELGIKARTCYEPGPADVTDVVVLAVQPQQFEDLASQHGPGTFAGALVVSVMAGVGIATMTRLLGTGRVIRSIPNTPSEVGEGMTVMVPGPGAAGEDLRIAQGVLECIGRVLTVQDEALIDDATALCGGGPAFIAHITEAITGFAVQAGFTPDAALMMTCQVLRGTADLMEISGRAPADLCREVMTPGGTTERGIASFTSAGLQATITAALAAAATRSRELGAIAA